MKTQAHIEALKLILPHCAPTILAEMVDDWSASEETREAAQLAFAEGCANCGDKDLASCLNADNPEQVLAYWHERGIY